jgi:hypothetical protein
MALDPFAPLKFGIRLGIGVLRFELRVIEQVLGLEREEPEAAVVVVEAEPEVVPEPAPEPEPEADAVEWEPIPEPPTRSPEPEPEPEPEPPTPIYREPDLVPEPEPESPVHIDTEPDLVGEFAETGAEEGAGAELHVNEPWEGYQRMRVADIRDRVAVAGPEELAVLQLYEITHRRRRSVLDAVERRSKQLANAPTR